jgi:hypothetical protein
MCGSPFRTSPRARRTASPPTRTSMLFGERQYCHPSMGVFTDQLPSATCTVQRKSSLLSKRFTLGPRDGDWSLNGRRCARNSGIARRLSRRTATRRRTPSPLASGTRADSGQGMCCYADAGGLVVSPLSLVVNPAPIASPVSGSAVRTAAALASSDSRMRRS